MVDVFFLKADAGFFTGFLGLGHKSFTKQGLFLSKLIRSILDGGEIRFRVPGVRSLPLFQRLNVQSFYVYDQLNPEPLS